MILGLVAIAGAADPLPGVYAFPSRPGDGVAVELQGVFQQIGVPNFDPSSTGFQLRGMVALSGRFTLDVQSGFASVSGCSQFFCETKEMFDVAARIGVAAVRSDRVRVVPFVGVGTHVQLGLAAWWQSPDARFELDLSAAAVFRAAPLIPGKPDVWEEIDNPPPNLKWRDDLLRPEFGLTLALDEKGVHHLRFGHFLYIPTLTYRAEAGAVSLEITGGTLVFGNILAAGVGGRF